MDTLLGSRRLVEAAGSQPIAVSHTPCRSPSCLQRRLRTYPRIPKLYIKFRLLTTWSTCGIPSVVNEEAGAGSPVAALDAPAEYGIRDVKA